MLKEMMMMGIGLNDTKKPQLQNGMSLITAELL